jgi:hypothetical protein
MNADLERLIRLQKLDAEILRKARLLDSLPKEIQHLSAELESARNGLKAFDAQVEADKKARRDLEREVEVVKDQIAKDKNKLAAVKTNVEYRAMLKELENFEKKIRETEDRQLEMMEKLEGEQNSRKGVEAKVKEEEARVKVAVAEKEGAIAELKKRMDVLLGDRALIVEGVSGSILSSYEKTLKARDGVGVARIADMICSGCNQMVPPQLYYQIKSSDDIYKCPHCSRYLYFEPEADENRVE